MTTGSGAVAAAHADRGIIAAIEAIYDAAPDPALWPHALQKIADSIGDVGAILIWRRDDGGFGTIVSPTLSEAQRDYEKNRWYLRDLPSMRVVERGLWLRSDAYHDSDAVTEEEMESHPFYTEFSARHGIHRRACVGVAPDPHISVWLAIQRGHKRSYSPAELGTVTRLAHHVEKALRLSIRLMDAELARLGLGDALARVGIGVFAFDALGRVVFSNPAGQHLLGPCLQIVDRHLRIGAGQQHFNEELLEVLRGEPGSMVRDPKPLLIHRSPPERPLVVYFLSIGSRTDPSEQFLTQTRAIALVIEPKPNDPADPAVVRDVFGLTLGEARVAALMAAGLPPRQISDRLNITEETVRTVLKRVYDKVGVSRQSELTALLGRLVMRTTEY